MIVSFFSLIWSGSPQILSTGVFQFKWYTFLLLAGFVIARWIFLRATDKLGVERSVAARWVIISVVSATLAARLVYVAAFQPFLFRLRIWQAFFPFEFQGGFRFLGTQEFSAIGAWAGVLLVVWLASRSLRISFNKLALPAVKGLMLLMVFLRLGDFLGSERFGVATESPVGIIFTGSDMQGLMKVPCCVMRTPDGENPLLKVVPATGNTLVHHQTGFRPVILYLFFKPEVGEQVAQEFLIGDVKGYLFDHSDHFYEPGDEPLHYTLYQQEDGSFIGRIQTVGVSRHPAQLYEMLAYLLLFFALYRFRGKTIGQSAGLCLALFFTVYYLLDYLREAPVIKGGPVHLEQVMCVPFVVLGLVLLVIGMRNSRATES